MIYKILALTLLLAAGSVPADYPGMVTMVDYNDAELGYTFKYPETSPWLPTLIRCFTSRRLPGRPDQGRTYHRIGTRHIPGHGCISHLTDITFQILSSL